MGAASGHGLDFEDEAEWNALCLRNRLRRPCKETKEEILKYHRMATRRRIQVEETKDFISIPLKMDMPGFATSVGWRNHRPPKDIDKLRSITVDDLQLGEVHKGCVLFGTLCEQPMACGDDHAVYTIMKDLGNPDSIVKVSFHSDVQSTTCKQAAVEFPIGTHLGIQEPLFKVYKDGTTGIRVDDMQHVFGHVGGLRSDSQSCRTRWDPPRSRGDEHSTQLPTAKCHYCGSEPEKGTKLKTCAGCMNISYCSSACQQADWKNHKAVCRAKGNGARDSTCTAGSPSLLTKGLYCKDNDFKVARKGLSSVPDPHFHWSREIWAVSPPDISQDGSTVTNVQMETTFCSSSPFGAHVNMCHVKILEPRAESVALGLCLVKEGKIDKSWKFSSDGSKFCGDRIQPYGEPFSVGDVITVVLHQGSLSFHKNGKDLGACFCGFDEAHHHYYLRGYLAAGRCNGFPVSGKANGGCMEILHLPPDIAMEMIPGKIVTIVNLQGRAELNGTAAQIVRLLFSGRVAVRTCGSGIEIAVRPENLQLGTSTQPESSQIRPETHNIEGSFGEGCCEHHGVPVDVNGRGLATCRTCSKSLSRSSFSKRSWKNFKSEGVLPQCQVCAKTETSDATVSKHVELA